MNPIPLGCCLPESELSDVESQSLGECTTCLEPSFIVLTDKYLLGLIGSFCPSLEEERWMSRCSEHQDPALPHINYETVWVRKWWSGFTIVIRRGVTLKTGKLSYAQHDKIHLAQCELSRGLISQEAERLAKGWACGYIPGQMTKCKKCKHFGHGPACCPDTYAIRNI